MKNLSESCGLARALSKLGHCSRSRAWELIQAARVSVNGKPCLEPERRVRVWHDKFAVDGVLVRPQQHVYLALNKPRGLVTTASDEKSRPTVYTCFAGADLPHVSPVGRLDKASEGLLLFTNDTEWADAITDPARGLSKRYHVQVDCIADEPLVRKLEGGVEVDRELLKAVRATILRHGERNSWLEITLNEGRNRHIRRLLEALGISVLRLVRVAISGLNLGSLQKGCYRHLTREEAESLRRKPGGSRHSG